MTTRPATSYRPKAHQPFNLLISQIWAAATQLLLSHEQRFSGQQSARTLSTPSQATGTVGQYLTIKDYTEAHSYTVPASEDQGFF